MAISAQHDYVSCSFFTRRFHRASTPRHRVINDDNQNRRCRPTEHTEPKWQVPFDSPSPSRSEVYDLPSAMNKLSLTGRRRSFFPSVDAPSAAEMLAMPAPPVWLRRSPTLNRIVYRRGPSTPTTSGLSGQGLRVPTSTRYSPAAGSGAQVDRHRLRGRDGTGQVRHLSSRSRGFRRCAPSATCSKMVAAALTISYSFKSAGVPTTP